MDDPKLDRVTDPAYLARIGDLPIEQIRTMRDECQSIEHALSYARRLAQGRLDIVGAELERRRAGGDPADLSALIERLPDILSDRVQGSGLPRPPQARTPELGDDYTPELDAIVSAARVASVADLDDEELRSVRRLLEDFEASASARRHRIHGVIDALQAEVTRRYRSGEASVDTLLR
jgi:hypothetical protein